jgi:hypothetical protein
MKYRPFKPIPRFYIDGINRTSYAKRKWAEKNIIAQILVRVSYLFSSYSVVFILALFIAVEVFRQSLTYKINNTISI